MSKCIQYAFPEERAEVDRCCRIMASVAIGALAPDAGAPAHLFREQLLGWVCPEHRSEAPSVVLPWITIDARNLRDWACQAHELGRL
mgnify:FL=1